jgi:hypothetical protein
MGLLAAAGFSSLEVIGFRLPETGFSILSAMDFFAAGTDFLKTTGILGLLGP